MLKKFLPFFAVAFISLSFLHSPVSGCVGRTLHVGARNTIQDRVLSELLVELISERTGTTVEIRLFDDDAKLYEALKSEDEEDRVDIIIEDTQTALAVLKENPASGNLDQQYLAVKDRYETELNIIWLTPFGFGNKIQDIETVSAPLVRMDVLTNYPLLPRVLNKLGGMIDDRAYSELIANARDGEKPKDVAKDFLRLKKLI